MEHVINVLKGAVIGIANAIPGVSGGTMMVIMKVFDRLMDAVSFDLKKLKKNQIRTRILTVPNQQKHLLNQQKHLPNQTAQMQQKLLMLNKF